MGFSLNRQTAVIELTHYGRMAGDEHRYFGLGLPPAGQQATMQKIAIAECMLECAATGERDPASCGRLR